MADDMEPELRIEPNPRWIRGVRRGVTVINSRDTKFVWTHPYYPAWYVPRADVGDPELVGETIDALPDHLCIPWDSMDHWFEEDTEVFVHPRDPYKRVDILPSSRHVTVRVDGTVVADSWKPVILYETLLPPRYYLPPTDVRLDLLRPTSTETACPYKGWANYWSVEVDGVEHEDIAWGYRSPLRESQGVAGLICFYNERVDIEIDGEPVARPVTNFT